MDTHIKRRLPPGSRGLPVIGETLEFLMSPSGFADRRLARYGKVYWSHVLGKPTVFLNGADANHWIFAGEGRYLENEWLPTIRRLLGARSLALLTGEAHKQRRKLLAPHFRRAAVGGAVGPIVDVARAHLRRWEDDARRGPIALLPRVRAMVFEIAATHILGRVDDLGVDLDTFSRDFDTWVGGFFVALPIALPGSRFARAMAARGRIFGLLTDLVRRRAAQPHADASMISTLLRIRDEQGAPLPREDIVDELHLLLFAGHDTTVTSITNAMYHLALAPAAMARAQAEQDALRERAYAPECLRAMPWLSAVIKESMRLIPPAAGSFRVMLEDAEYAGYTIPRGWRVAVGPRGAHREAANWPEPERFDPERFLREPDDRPPFAYIPFGGGPRMCIGQHFAMLEMHVVLAMLLRAFSWTLAPGQDPKFREIPLPRQRSGTVVELRPRPDATP